jgi:hypothetical protein
MLRAGPLSSPEVIGLLNECFVSSWVLAKDLEHLSLDPAASPELRELARALRARYEYPVDTQVVMPDGRLPDWRLIGQLGANEALDALVSDETYFEFFGGCLDG